MCTSSSESGSPMVKHQEWKQPVTKAEFDAARELHDVFNLACMPAIIYYTIMDFQWSIFVDEFTFEWQQSSYFWYLWWWTMTYTVADSLWIVLVPHCVRTPKTIVEHHLFVLVYLLVPLPWKYFRPFMGPLMSVEINSFFSFARRVAWKKEHWSGNVFHVLFMVTWILTRVLIYPALMFVYCRIALAHLHMIFTPFALAIFVMPVHGYFVVMNLIWTRDLFTPIIKNCVKSARIFFGMDKAVGKEE